MGWAAWPLGSRLLDTDHTVWFETCMVQWRESQTNQVDFFVVRGNTRLNESWQRKKRLEIKNFDLKPKIATVELHSTTTFLILRTVLHGPEKWRVISLTENLVNPATSLLQQKLPFGVLKCHFLYKFTPYSLFQNAGCHFNIFFCLYSNQPFDLVIRLKIERIFYLERAKKS